MNRPILEINGNNLTLESIDFILNENPIIKLSSDSIARIQKSRALVEKWVEEEKPIYGITTGFGEFSNVFISKENSRKLQENLIVSHSVGVGEPIPPFITKIMMILRANALAKGYSGIRLETLLTLLEMANLNIIPYIPAKGSVGSSGDLVQLSHLALAMIGKGKCQKFDTVNRNAKFTALSNSDEILLNNGIKPIELSAKEGLALINGAQMMTAYGAFICLQARKLAKLADISAALSHEALRGSDKAYDERIHKLRPYDGQLKTARNLLKLIENSEIRKSHLTNDTRIQDAYSLRCIPQIHGASRDAIEYACSKVEIEINSATDNPLIFPDDEIALEGGNFHGQPIAIAMDLISIALSELANVSERRIERMVNGSLSGLPRFLTPKGGLNSGFMIAQYTAASLVSENKVLAHPASVDSIPTSANQEDHNSMGSIAAQKAYQVLQNLEAVLAIELLTAAQAVEFLKPLKLGKGTSAIYDEIRKFIPFMDEDRILHHDLCKMLELIKSNHLLSIASKVVTLE